MHICAIHEDMSIKHVIKRTVYAHKTLHFMSLAYITAQIWLHIAKVDHTALIQCGHIDLTLVHKL